MLQQPRYRHILNVFPNTVPADPEFALEPLLCAGQSCLPSRCQVAQSAHETFPHSRKMGATMPWGGQPLGCWLLSPLLAPEQYLIRQVWIAALCSNLIWWSQGHGWPLLNQSATKPSPKIASRRGDWCHLVEASMALPLHLYPALALLHQLCHSGLTAYVSSHNRYAAALPQPLRLPLLLSGCNNCGQLG